MSSASGDAAVAVREAAHTGRAGIVLGFAGLLITLAPDVPRLTVHDTLEDFVNEGSDILQSKGRLGRALASLSLAATGLARGIVVEAL